MAKNRALCERVIATALSAPDEVLMMSRRHCHAKNIDSIVIQRSLQGRLTRVFLARAGHALDANECTWNVGVHDHLYDLTLSLLGGVVTNATFEPSQFGTFSGYHHRFVSPISGSESSVKLCGETRSQLAMTLRARLEAGVPVVMSADDLHTVGVEGVAAWMVQEGFRRKVATNLFSPHKEIDVSGLYEPFSSRREVLECLIPFLEALLRKDSP